MKFEEIRSIFEELKFDVFSFDDDFFEFHGKLKSSKGVSFDIEGSIETAENGNAIAYSVNFLDEEKNYEYDGIFGTLHNVEKDDIINLIQPDFVECA